MDVTRLVTNPLVVVTNREPYVDEKTGTGTRTIQLAGGVVSALDPLLQEIGGDWIAWGSGSADRQTAPRGIREVPPKRPRYRLHRVFLLPAEEQGYYTHYSNQGLWPLSHMLVERARFSRRAWPYYRSVNQKFARVTAAKTELKGWYSRTTTILHFFRRNCEPCVLTYPLPISGTSRGPHLLFFDYVRNISKFSRAS